MLKPCAQALCSRQIFTANAIAGLATIVELETVILDRPSVSIVLESRLILESTPVVESRIDIALVVKSLVIEPLVDEAGLVNRRGGIEGTVVKLAVIELAVVELAFVLAVRQRGLSFVQNIAPLVDRSASVASDFGSIDLDRGRVALAVNLEPTSGKRGKGNHAEEKDSTHDSFEKK